MKTSFELFVAGRYLRARRKEAVISIITVISVLGVAAGVMALVIALAVNNGFRGTLQRNLLGAMAHINVMPRQPGEGIGGWRQLVQLDSSSEFRAVTWLGIWLEKVRKALALKKSGMSQATIAQQLKIWPFKMVGPFFQTADRLGEAGVARAIDLLVQLDHQSKSGVGDAAENVERFLLSVNSPR